MRALAAGLRLDFRELLRAEFYWGGRLLDAEKAQADGMQRHGMHFLVSLDALALARSGAKAWWR